MDEQHWLTRKRLEAKEDWVLFSIEIIKKE